MPVEAGWPERAPGEERTSSGPAECGTGRQARMTVIERDSWSRLEQENRCGLGIQGAVRKCHSRSSVDRILVSEYIEAED
jgi:hypothetical protein